MSDDEVKGVVYFSGGVEGEGGGLIKYNFSTKKKEFLFKDREESELGKKITRITYPVYLKSKNKMLFIGGDLSEDHIFESDLNLMNWREYRNTKNVKILSLSPDESMVAYYKHPNKLVIKRYEDLEKEDYERIVANNFFISDISWISNEEIVYRSTDDAIVKVNIQNGEQKILAEGVYPDSISPDKKYILCGDVDKGSMYLYDLSTSKLLPVKKNKEAYYSSAPIWSPDGKHFLFLKLQKVKFTFNIFKFWNDMIAERMDLYLYSLATGEGEKLIENIGLFGGFWLENKPD